MAKFYSATLGGFLDDAVHATMPADAVAISDARHADLLAAQSAGRIIAPGFNGEPIAIDRPAPDIEARRAALVARTKLEAARRIEAVAPLWRQLNDVADIARASAAGLEEPHGPWARREAINAIRDASDRLEARIASLGARALAQVDVAAASHWPR